MRLLPRIARLERAAEPALDTADRRAKLAAVLSDPRVRPLAERVNAAYDAEPQEKRIGDWRWRVRLEQPEVRLAWLVVSQVLVERLGDGPIPWSIVLPESRRAAAALRREAGLGEMPPECRP